MQKIHTFFSCFNKIRNKQTTQVKASLSDSYTLLLLCFCYFFFCFFFFLYHLVLEIIDHHNKNWTMVVKSSAVYIWTLDTFQPYVLMQIWVQMISMVCAVGFWWLIHIGSLMLYCCIWGCMWVMSKCSPVFFSLLFSFCSSFDWRSLQKNKMTVF